MPFSSSSSLLFLSLYLLFLSSLSDHLPFKGKAIDIGNPIVHFLPPIHGYSSKGAGDIILCERVQIHGLSRFNIKSYSSSFRVDVKPEISHSKIEVCLHLNASLEVCQCEKDEWKPIQTGLWSITISPFEDRYLDVKLEDRLSGSITVSIREELQQWRLLFLGFGFVLLLLAPIISGWVPFYYSSSMALGVLLVVIILLFQVMKLIPTGRKIVFYFTLYGSVVGAGSFLVHYLSMFVNSILINFGLNEDMHNPVSIFVILGIFLAGAALGHWTVRKFVLAEDGSVDVGVAQFVKWAMRIIALVSVLQSTLDPFLALVSFCTCWSICSIMTSMMWRLLPSKQLASSTKRHSWHQNVKHASAYHNRAEFFSRTAKLGSDMTVYQNPSTCAWSNSPTKGLVVSSPWKAAAKPQEYFSTFHKTPVRKRFSKEEWEDFTNESTRKAMAELASSPQFTEWIIGNADRVRTMPDQSSNDSMDSGSDSSEDDTFEETSSRLSFFKLY